MLHSSPRTLHVVAYHYIRDPSRTPFPRLHAFSPHAFRTQIRELQTVYEMATVESALDFIAGRYQPVRDLCLLTFDDGLRDHFDEVFPSLQERRIQGVFFLITGCLEGQVASAHQSQFLMAHLGLDEYRKRVLKALNAINLRPVAIDTHRARATYRWDTPQAAEFKYLLNFLLPDDVKDAVLRDLFAAELGDQAEFARRLYLDWPQAAAMQADRMVAGGHTHTHRPLSNLSPPEQRLELTTCTTMLRQKLPKQTLWPFSFPFGKLGSFDAGTLSMLRELGYDCAFTTVHGSNHRGDDPFTIRRIDPKEVVYEQHLLAPWPFGVKHGNGLP